MQTNSQEYWQALRTIKAIAQKCGDEGDRIFEAFEYASALHKDQKRKSGEPYITHPVSVAEIIAREFEILDVTLLCAALLHDTVEDVPHVDLSDLRKRFGQAVADFVDGCTKIGLGHDGNSVYMTHSKILKSASRRLGVLIIKLADRLHNLRTLHYLSSAKRQKIATETLDIYAPLAAKLNIYHLKRELYNLSLMYLYPRKSKKILNHINQISNDPKIVEIRSTLEEALRKLGISAQVRSRCKGLGSYYNAQRKTLEVHNAENYVDFTIVVSSEDELLCYEALGIVNRTYPPLPRTIRDFIASPKANGYRSLHARFHHAGQNYLVKIRTPSMDTWAQYGILRRWREDKEFFREEHDDEIAEFLREIAEYQGPSTHRKELLRYTEGEEIAVYTPKGDLYFLPKESTVLDFAYRIHTQLGDHCRGGLIDGKKVSPVYPLYDGATVEILTTTEVLDVDPEYETICKTLRARAGVQKLIQRRRRFYAEKIGREIFQQIITLLGLKAENANFESMELILKKTGSKSETDLYVKLGQDVLGPEEVRRIVSEIISVERGGFLRFQSRQLAVTIGQIDRAVHKFAYCCKPYPGEDNCMALLSERGVTIHKGECTDAVTRHSIPPDRLFRVDWLLDDPWDSPIVFRITVPGVSLGRLLAKWPDTSEYEVIELAQKLDRYGHASALCLARMKSLRDAKNFFDALTRDFNVSIETYFREKSMNGDRP
ncbi:RelA/SpoT family protein [Thermodesulforhabdus norvegica]|uniref:GTP pyrophosphokinase n=1 Tax=Thermodesulforhabdus norvegica TaxID=39841 RepID=A0A1I4T8H8_9BACT|nr:HD domain-containing protein [Thermodesulforhabdus norvegica]SFM72996.1 GTP pyrophosphokinase [Thermodesulforhabdus norvegica]